MNESQWDQKKKKKKSDGLHRVQEEWIIVIDEMYPCTDSCYS